MEYANQYMLLVLMIVRLNAPELGYSTGAPWVIVLSPSPKHGTQRQTSPCPFSLYLNQSHYLPGDTIHCKYKNVIADICTDTQPSVKVNVTLRSKANDRTLKGIQIRARPYLGDHDNVLGRFVSWPENKTKPISVFGGQNPSPSFEVVDWSAYGETKGCFLYPRTCTGYDCYAAVTYKTVNQTVEFEMFGSQSGYISLGFSNDKYMGDDETISCTADDTTEDMRVGIQRGRNDIKLYNERQLKAGVTHMQGTYSDGKLYCRFTRPLVMSLYIGIGHTTTLTYDLNDDFYLMLAWGAILHGTEVMKRHLELPPISDGKVDLQEYVIIRGSSLLLNVIIKGPTWN